MDKKKEFFDFIQERQSIWYKRFILKENPPWTKDHVLQKYKIINVYRELDKGTEYIINKLKDVKERKEILLNVIFYRFFNKYNLYENLNITLLKEINKELLIQRFDKIKKEGRPIFSDAYLIGSSKNKEKKHVYIINIMNNLNIKNLMEEIDRSETPEESLGVLQKIKNVGPFLAYEIWTDLTYFNFFKQGWTDNDFVNIGPGADWGLNIIYNQRLSKSGQMEKIYCLHEKQKEFLGNKAWMEIYYKDAFSNRPFLSLRNIEHSLCEFRKYYNLSNGKGKKRIFNHKV